eukprot:CAMPEP_0202454488 /NCGR_PEP_ID=MMETSP1360-20130828/12206_1 /ASSEMBLY_ACC=CAM_ASM_000848 /TAXON_ID=515479 /ORGANISM="Licmophora paradoxa, Strain CCMP2313" /LENGTH=38 /DNA_ID= /DNA_START= /DNA_END= /DNA_ORIENTATION=
MACCGGICAEGLSASHAMELVGDNSCLYEKKVETNPWV